MKLLTLLLSTVLLLGSCGDNKKQRGRINYTAIKEKAGISGSLEKKFDDITQEYGQKMKELSEKNKEGNKETLKEERQKLSEEQDEKIRSILSDNQFGVYSREIKIERTGREKYNVSLIKEELDLDSTQAENYEKTQAVFYKTLRDNHDSYHGKPDVYKQFYQELDLSRKAALEKFLTKNQYNQYLILAEKYKLGQGGEK